MKWHGLLRRNGFQAEVAGAEIDPFMSLPFVDRAAGTPTIHVSCNLGTAREYGEVKCGFTVTVACPQTEKYIDMAGEMAYRKALELTNDAASQLGIPMLPPFQEPA